MADAFASGGGLLRNMSRHEDSFDGDEESKGMDKSPQEIYEELGPTALFLRTTTARKAAVLASSKAAKEQEEENARRAAEARRKQMEKQLRQGSLCGLFELKPTLPRLQSGESEWEPFLTRRSVLGLEFADLLRLDVDANGSAPSREAPEWLASLNADFIKSPKKKLTFEDLKQHDQTFDSDVLALFGSRPRIRVVQQVIQHFVQENEHLLKEKRAPLSKAYSSDRAILTRESIRTSPRFNALVTLFWLAADIDDNNTLTRDGYLLLNRKLQIAVLGHFDDGYGYELAERDWEIDAQGEDTLQFAKLAASLFLLADMFVSKLDENNYCYFLQSLAQRTLHVDMATRSILEFRADHHIISRKTFAFVQHSHPSWRAFEVFDTPKETRKFFGQNTVQVENIIGTTSFQSTHKGKLAQRLHDGLARKRADRKK